MIKVKADLHFANVQKIKELLSRIERLGSHVIHPGEDRQAVKIKAVVIHAEGINRIDARYKKKKFKKIEKNFFFFFFFAVLPK